MKTMTFGDCPAYQEVQGNEFLEIFISKYPVLFSYAVTYNMCLYLREIIIVKLLNLFFS